MRTIQGFAAAEEFIRSRPPLEETNLPPAVMARTREVLGPGLTADQAVAAILARVRAEGDAAVRDLTQRFDGVTLSALEVSADELAQAQATVEPSLVSDLEVAPAQ